MRGDRWFPRVERGFRIERTTTDLAGQPLRHEYAYGITSCLPEEAPPEDLLHFVQGHWGIENKVHWVRDVVFDEDRSQIRTGHGPRVMATLRNLVVSLLRLHGHPNLAQATRQYHAGPFGWSAPETARHTGPHTYYRAKKGETTRCRLARLSHFPFGIASCSTAVVKD